MRSEKHAPRRDRWRAVLPALEGGQARRITEALGRARQSVQDWVYAYRRGGGVDAIQPKPRPGRPTKLPRNREAELTARLDAGPRDADGVCTLRGRPLTRLPFAGMLNPRILARVGVTSALLTDVLSTKPALKSGPIAAMLLNVSPRPNVPCIPCPCCRPLSAMDTWDWNGLAGSVENERKFTTIAGLLGGVAPLRLIALRGRVPAIEPY